MILDGVEGMMGERSGTQDRLFYEFCLEDCVPSDHMLCRIDAVLDLSWLRAELAPYYSHTGCPSVDPELMIRMLLVGYCYSIRSERRLCQEVEFNLAYRWFCRNPSPSTAVQAASLRCSLSAAQRHGSSAARSFIG